MSEYDPSEPYDKKIARFESKIEEVQKKLGEHIRQVHLPHGQTFVDSCHTCKNFQIVIEDWKWSINFEKKKAGK